MKAFLALSMIVISCSRPMETPGEMSAQAVPESVMRNAETSDMESAMQSIEIALADNRATIRSQRLTIVVTLSLLVLSVGSFAVTHTYLRRRRERQSLEEMQLIMQLRLQSARKILSSHLLLNAINAVAPKDSTITDHLVKIARFSVLMLDKNMVPLRDELSMSRECAGLHKAVHPDDPEITWNISPGVDMDCQVPTLCIQTHLENALKYAGAKLIEVNVSKGACGVRISVKDDGVGYLNSSPGPGQGTGKGIQTMSRTIALLNGTRKNKMSYEILSVAGRRGTEAVIFIPDEDKDNNNR